MSAAAPRMALGDSLDGQSQAPPRAVNVKGFNAVCGTRWLEPAIRTQEGTDCALIDPYESDEKATHGSKLRHPFNGHHGSNCACGCTNKNLLFPLLHSKGTQQ